MQSPGGPVAAEKLLAVTGFGLPSAALERLAGVRVGLRSDLEVNRQISGGGRVQYVVHDPVSFENNLFDAHEYRVLAAIDARCQLGDVFQRLVDSGVLEADQHDEFYDFVLLQHQRRLLRLPIADGHRTWERARLRRQQDRKLSPLRKLMYWRVPLWSPDRFLEKTLPYVGWIFGRYGIALWCALMAFACWASSGRLWDLLTSAPELLALDNLAVLWVTLVGLKVFHEFGHAYACRHLGGNVPEMGLAFVLGAPCAYVDASSAWKLSNPWHRIGISMGGMYAESFLAAIALIVWVGAEEGLVRTVAQNVVVLATAVTVLFNINPLMKFDGYYVLADLIREPNLRARSSSELARLGRKLLRLPVPAAGSRARLHLTYGVGAFVYKILLSIGIVTTVVLGWPLVGAALGVVFAWMMLGQPTLRCVRWLWRDPETREIRWKARGIAVAMVTVLPILAVVAVPVGLEVEVPGIVVSERGEHVLRAPIAGFVRALPAAVGDGVCEEAVVVVLEAPELEQQLWSARGELDANRQLRMAAEGTDPVAATVARQRERRNAEIVASLEQRIASTTIRSPVRGTVTRWARPDLLGAYVQIGDPLVIVEDEERRIEAWIPARDIERSRISIADLAEIRYLRDLVVRHDATVIEVDPVADRSDLPELLTTSAGGPIRLELVEGADRAERAYVRLLLEPEQMPPDPSLGMAVRVRFTGRLESLGNWMFRQGLGFTQQWRLSGSR